MGTAILRGSVGGSAPLQMAGTASIALHARPGRPARTAGLVTRFCLVTALLQNSDRRGFTLRIHAVRPAA